MNNLTHVLIKTLCLLTSFAVKIDIIFLKHFFLLILTKSVYEYKKDSKNQRIREFSVRSSLLLASDETPVISQQHGHWSGLWDFKTSLWSDCLSLCLFTYRSGGSSQFLSHNQWSDENWLNLYNCRKLPIKCFLLQEPPWSWCLFTANTQWLRQRTCMQ